MAHTQDHQLTKGNGMDAADEAEVHAEGPIAKAIENQTAKLPSDVFLWAAGASIIGALVLQLRGRKQNSLFIGTWAPTLLMLGLYNKLVKVAGSDRLNKDNHTLH